MVLSSALSFLKKIVFSKYFAWVCLIAVILLALKACNDYRELQADFEQINLNTASHIESTTHELKAELTSSQMKAELREKRIARLLDSLRIKPKNVYSVKRIETERLIHDTITDLEFVVSEECGKMFTYNAKCIEFTFDTRRENPVLDMKINNNLVDINYSLRRKLFNLKFAPRLGKKETFQTLVSECGDTILKNHKLEIK